MQIDRIAAWGEAEFSDPATPDEIEAAEAQLGHRLPDGLRTLLAESNGIVAETGEGLLWDAARIGRENALFRTHKVFPELYMPFEGLVFFGDPGNGDQFFMSLSGLKQIFLWDHETDSRVYVAWSVLDYLEKAMHDRLEV
ncbi:SMI1/KNR4 family protein [Cellulomonas sp. CW35]|uniref:SMI1/KNR4 family protein n=1 Tax=Cellulomonas sp. CW35 TaxID=3458249 RepID=UPI0022804CD6